MILAELLTGRVAYAEADLAAMRRAKLAGPPQLDGVDADLRALITDLTTPVPADRPALDVVRRTLRPAPAQPAAWAATANTFSLDPPLDDTGDHPEVIGRYRTLGVLGRGGMGVVLRARDPTLDRDVAVKLTQASRASADRFRREAQAVARLDHPNIVRVLDAGSSEAGLFLVMQLVEGPTLAEHADGPMAPEAAVRLVLPIARALAHAHAAGLVHRDVKPGNILLEPDGTPRLTDFGLVVDLQEDRTRLTRHGQLLGTPRYMAPEQARGARDAVDGRTDVYALGLVLYELVVGASPFDGTHPAQILYQILSADLAWRNPLVPDDPAIDRMCRRALAFDPDDRYPTMAAFAADLERFLEGTEVRPAGPSRRRRLGWTLRRARPALLGIGVTGLLAALLAGGWLAWTQRAADAAVRQRAAEAADRWASTRETVDAHRAAGRADEAAALVDAFVGLPAHQGTPALVDAWLAEAAWARETQDWEGEPRALAGAYRDAAAPDDQARVLLGLGELFRRRWQWAAVDTVLGVVGDEADDAEVGRLRDEVDLVFRRRTVGRTVPFADLLAEGRRDLVPDAALRVADVDGDGTDELVAMYPDRPTTVHALGPDLPLHPTLTLPPEVPHAHRWLRRRGPDHWQWLGHADGAVHLTTLRDGAVTTDLRWEDAAPHVVTSADLDGDGADELYLGMAAYTRRLYRLRETPAGWVRDDPHPGTSEVNSSVMGLFAADLDGDGGEELAVAPAAFGAYDVRVLVPGDASPLDLAARDKLGHVRHIAPLAAPGGGTWIVASKFDEWGSRVFFGPDAPFGAAAGVHVLRWTAGGPLERVAHLAPPSQVWSTRTGDLDGDGLTDVAVAARGGTALYRQEAPGVFGDPVFVHGGLGAVLQADADPAMELVLRFAEDPDALWVMGVDGEAPPERPQDRTVIPEAPPDLGAFADLWSRADDLVRMGLVAEAAEAFEGLADAASGSPLAADALLRASHLREGIGRLDEAEAGFARVAESDDRPEALGGVVRCADARHRFTVARDAAAALRALPGLSDDDRAHWEAEHARLADLVPDAPWSVDLADPGPDVQFPDPLTTRWSSGDDALAVTFAGEHDVVRIPVDWNGGPFAVEGTLDLDRLEWGGGFWIGLRPRTPGAGLTWGMKLHGVGGSGELSQHLVCTTSGGPDRSWGHRRPEVAATDRLTFRYSAVPAAGRRLCELAGFGTGTLGFTEVDEPREALDPAGYDLVVAGPTLPNIRWNPTAEVRLRSLTLTGLTPIPDDADVARAGRELVAGRADVARPLVDALPDDTDGRVLRATTAIALGVGVPDALADVVADPEAGPWVQRLVRVATGPVRQQLAAALGAEWPVRFDAAWGASIGQHPHDAHIQRALVDALPDLGVAPGPDVHLHAQLLMQRADAHRRQARPARALADAERALALVGEASRAHEQIALVAVQRGDHDRAIAVLTASLARATHPEITADRWAAHPDLAPLHDHPRWAAITAARRLAP